MTLGWIQLQIQLFWSNFCADVGPQKLEIFTSLSVYSILLGVGRVKVPYWHESDRDGDILCPDIDFVSQIPVVAEIGLLAVKLFR